MQINQTLQAKKYFHPKHNDFFISKNEKVIITKIENDKIHLDYVKEELKLKHLLHPEIHSLYVRKEDLSTYFKTM